MVVGCKSHDLGLILEAIYSQEGFVYDSWVENDTV